MKFIIEILLILLVFIFYFLIRSEVIHAYSSEDAKKELVQLAGVVKAKDDAREARRLFNLRVAKVRAFLESYQSPMVADSATFVRVADSVGLNYRLLPSISIVESTGGRFIPVGSHNAFGWNRGRSTFRSFEDAIATVGRGLGTGYQYWDLRATAYRYCPPSDCDTERWIGNVQRLMDSI